MSPGGSRASRLLLAVAVAVFCAACRADVAVTVVIEEDGSGQVEVVTTLDAEAADLVIDLDEDSTGLPLNDLAQSGWIVGPPTRQPDGSMVVEASKAFGTSAQFREVMDEISGPSGVFRNFDLDRTKTFARVDYEVTGTIDTTGGLAAFGDGDLDRALGRSLVDIAESYGATDDDVGVSLDIELPGESQGPPPPEAAEADPNRPRAVWIASMGEPDVISLDLASAERQVSALVLRGVAVVAAVLAGLVVFAQVLRILLPDRRRRTPRRRSTDRPRSSGGRRDDRADANLVTEDAATGEHAAIGPTRHTVVALDGMGVLYRWGEGQPKPLTRFARNQGSPLTDDDIEAKVRMLELGRITPGQFWPAIGVDGDPDALDADYLAELQLTPGVVKYLRSLRDRGTRVACVTNDAVEWVSKLRASSALEGLVDPWVVSGSVGVRKPDPAIFEVVRRVTGTAPASILVVDDDIEVLDAARQLGFATAWFTLEGSRDNARGHTILRSFELLDEPEPSEDEAPA